MLEKCTDANPLPLMQFGKSWNIRRGWLIYKNFFMDVTDISTLLHLIKESLSSQIKYRPVKTINIKYIALLLGMHACTFSKLNFTPFRCVPICLLVASSAHNAEQKQGKKLSCSYSVNEQKHLCPVSAAWVRNIFLFHSALIYSSLFPFP